MRRSEVNPNPQRGEVAVVIDGIPRRLRLTLGALAALEARLEENSLMGLAERFETGQVRTADLTALLAAGLSGAGEPVSEEALGTAEFEGGALGAMRAGMALLSATFRPLGDG
ncbi:MAG: gene transfer agent family protein [Pseudomonadota bacterium]